MEINKKLVIDDIRRLRRYLMNDPSKDDILLSYPSLLSMNRIFEIYSEDELAINRIFANPEEVRTMFKKFNKKNLDELCFFLDAADTYLLTLFGKYNQMLTEDEFEIFPKTMCKSQRYTEKEMKDLILSYYSIYGDSIYKKVKQIINEERICYTDRAYEEETWHGEFISSTLLKSGYINVTQTNSSLLDISGIVHEIGHYLDSLLFLFPQQKKLPLFNDYLIEVPSGYFEIMFIDYLIKNKINIDEARLLLNERIAMVGDTHGTLDAILSKTDVDVDTNGFFFVKDEFGTFKVDGRSDLIYGFGYLFALNMMVLGRDNPKKFMKTFSNFITSRAESSLDEIIEIMGISVDEFTDSEIIRPRIKEETYQLKKRYNMI